jgi:hypothetical protein
LWLQTINIMDIKGKVIQLLPLQTGQGKNGEWRKQDFVIETDAQYPKKICLSAWGDKIDEQALQVGNEITVFFDLESREYNGKWYTDAKAWKIESGGGQSEAAPQPARAASQGPKTGPPPLMTISEDLAGDDNLPF